MVTTYIFNLFPVEIIRGILNHLWAHEIFYAFSDLSPYVNSILNSYDRYSISLSSMPKHQFDLTCSRIHVEQVISIAIDENDDTPDQIELFFSKFNIIQFVNLRSFAILSFDQGIFKQFVPLCELNNFQSLTLPNVSQAYWCLFGSIVEAILPRLKKINTNKFLLTQPLNNLKYLTVKQTTCYNLTYILRHVSQLYSLNITMSLNLCHEWTGNIPVMDRLRRLTLNINYGRLMMIKINQFLSKLPRLVHFELEIDYPIDVVGHEQWISWSRYSSADMELPADIIDGHQWKYLVSHLQTFDFRFCLTSKLDPHILDSFRSSFWLENKKWFVAYDDTQSVPCLFTIPRFAQKSIIYSSDYCVPLCTSSSQCLDVYVETLTLPVCCPLKHNFINLISIILQKDDDPYLDIMLSYLQLPNVQSLTLSDTSLLTQLSSNIIFKSILSLKIDETVMRSHAKIIRYMFPRLERLHIKVDNYDTMLLLIDELKYLSIVSFICCQLSSGEPLTHDWFVKNSLRLMANSNFTFKVNFEKIHLWISVK